MLNQIQNEAGIPIAMIRSHTDMQVAIEVAKPSKGLETKNLGLFTLVEEEAERIMRSAGQCGVTLVSSQSSASWDIPLIAIELAHTHPKPGRSTQCILRYQDVSGDIVNFKNRSGVAST